MSDHTPGPWVYGPDAYCPDCAHSVMAPKAAKALLAARSLADMDCVRLFVRAAIAKAEGRA